MAGTKTPKFKELRQIILSTPEYQLEKIIAQVGIRGEEEQIFRERYIEHMTVTEVSEKHHFSTVTFNTMMNRILLKIRKSLIDLQLNDETCM